MLLQLLDMKEYYVHILEVSLKSYHHNENIHELLIHFQHMLVIPFEFVYNHDLVEHYLLYIYHDISYIDIHYIQLMYMLHLQFQFQHNYDLIEKFGSHIQGLSLDTPLDLWQYIV